MNNPKTVFRFFTIADFKEEETWLRNQHQEGWKFLKMVPPCFYTFEQCPPEDVMYRLDYQNGEEDSGYFQLFKDYGWEYIDRSIGWIYFRKPVSEADSERDGELFSDNESRLNLIDHVVKTRMLPAMLLFLCCVFPNLWRSIDTGDPFAAALTGFFAVMALLFLYLLVYCGVKLQRMRKEYKED